MRDEERGRIMSESRMKKGSAEYKEEEEGERMIKGGERARVKRWVIPVSEEEL